jgi:polysaccharide biosynthesis transport protein
MTHRTPTSVGTGGFIAAADPSSRLEPLGVPIARFGAILRRQYLTVLLVLMVGIGCTVAVVASLPKQYTAETSILIEPRRTQVSDLQAISPDSGDVATSLLRTQIDILRSPTLLSGVVEALRLADNPGFAGRRSPLLVALSTAIHTLGGGSQQPEPVLSYQDRIQVAATVLGGMLTFANELRSSVLQVKVTTGNADLSARIANELSRQFLEFKRQEKFSVMQRAHDWFQDQLEGLSNDVHTTEMALEKYRTEHGLLDLPADGTSGALRTTSVARQQLSDIARQLAEASRDRAHKEAKLAQANAAAKGQQTSALPEVLVSPMIAQLLAQEAAVAGREAQLAASQGGNNPELAAVRAQLRRLQAKVAQEAADIVQSLSTEVKAARAQEETLRRRTDMARDAVGAENAAEVGLQGLQAKARTTRSIYESFLGRATQLANVAGIQEPDASLVSSARPPLGPSAPRPVRYVAAAGALSLALGIGLACFIERVRRGFGSADQLEGSLGLALVGLLPEVSSKACRLRSKGRGALKLTAALDKLRGHLRTLGDARPKLVMVSSSLPQEGKSVFAAGLAANAAAAGWRVLLIDCDFRRPSIASYFGQPLTPGLSEVLKGGMLGDNQTVIREARPCLHVMPAGNAGGDPQELLASNRMIQLLGAVRARYDLVVLDTPPVLPVADALVLSRHADATIMVVRWEKTPRTVVQDATRLLRHSGAHLLGAVLTRVDLRTAAQMGGRPGKAYDYYSSYNSFRS